MTPAEQGQERRWVARGIGDGVEQWVRGPSLKKGEVLVPADDNRALVAEMERIEKACKNHGTRESKDGACAALTKLLHGDEPYSDVHGRAIQQLSMAFNRLEGDVLRHVEAALDQSGKP